MLKWLILLALLPGCIGGAPATHCESGSASFDGTGEAACEFTVACDGDLDYELKVDAREGSLLVTFAPESAWTPIGRQNFEAPEKMQMDGTIIHDAPEDWLVKIAPTNFNGTYELTTRC